MTEFILKSAGSLAFFLIFYQIFLSKEKVLKFSRFYLLATLLLSFFIPLISLPDIFNENQNVKIFVANPAVFNQNLLPKTSNFPWQNFILAIWIACSVLTLVSFCKSMYKLKNLQGENSIKNGIKVKFLDENLPPFSFWDTIYFSKKQLKNGEIPKEIFVHEKCHISQKHSVDILLVEILTVIFWFNPFLYLYKKVIAQNHEFLADEAVLNEKFNLKNYSELILNQIFKNQIQLASSFNFQNTKKRFIMMTTKKSQFATVKKLTVIPAIAISAMLFSQKMIAENAVIQKVETPKTLAKSENPAEFPGGISEFRTKILNEFDASKFLDKKGAMKAEVMISIDENGKVDNVSVDGENPDFVKETLRTVRKVAESESWKPATENGKPVKSMMKLPILMQF